MCKMVEKSGTVSAKLCALQRIFCVQDNKYKQKSEVQELPARSRKVVDIRSPESKWAKFWWPSIARGKQHQGGLNRTCQADSPVISEYTNLKKLLVVGREKGSILQDCVKCVLPIRSEVKLDTFVNSALFRFTKGLVLRNTFQWQTTRLSTCIFCSLRLRSLIYSVKPWVRICYGVEHSKRLKCLVTRGYLIKRPARRQCVNIQQPARTS